MLCITFDEIEESDLERVKINNTYLNNERFLIFNFILNIDIILLLGTSWWQADRSFSPPLIMLRNI